MKKSKKNTDRLIPYRPELTAITGSVTSALLLEQLSYWWKRKAGKTLYKTDQELASELGFGLKALRSAKKKLIDAKLVKTVLKDIPRRTHYTAVTDTNKLLTLVANKKGNQENQIGQDSVTKEASKCRQKGQANSCNTQFNTHLNSSHKCITHDFSCIYSS